MDTCRSLHDFALIQPKPSPGKLFFRQNGPATAAPLQEGRFWRRSETKKRILRVAQNSQMRAALQELP